MRSYTLLAPAKINLYLEIVGDRPDGYHELVMVMQSVALYDQIEVRANGTEAIRLFCDHPLVPTDTTNLAYRAADLLRQTFPEAFGRYGGVDITLQKHIPVGAGLAGGSGNAAAVLVGLDLLWRLGLTQDEIQELGAQIGSDVPFCVSGGTALATGRGEKIDSMPNLKSFPVILAKYRNLSVATAWAYKTYRQQFHDSYLCTPEDLECRRQQLHSGPMMAAIAQGAIHKVAQHLHNDLEKVVLPAYPAVARLRQHFQEAGCLGTMMSGSGPTVFGIAPSPTEATAIAHRITEAIADPELDVWVTHAIGKGVHLAESAPSETSFYPTRR